MIAIGLPQRKAVQAAEARHIGGRDHRAAHQILLIAGELSPECWLQIGILANRDRAGIGKTGSDHGGGIVKTFQAAFAHQHRKMMIAKADRSRAQLIARGEHICTFGLRVFIGAFQPADGKVDPLTCALAFLRCEALAHDHFAGQAQHGIEQARTGRFGIVLQAQHGGEISSARSAQFHRINPETGPAIGNHPANIGFHVRFANRPHLAIVERGKQLEQLIIGLTRRAGIIAKRLCAIFAKTGSERLQGSAQGTQIPGVNVFGFGCAAAEEFARPLCQTSLAASRAAHQRNKLVIHEQRAGRQFVAPAPVNMRRKRVFKLRVQLHRNAATDDVVIHHEARVEVGAQHHLARRRMGIKRVGVLGLEQQARHLQRAHQRTVAQQHDARIDQPRVGQPVTRVGFLRAPCSSSEPLGIHALLLPPIRRRMNCSPSVCNSSRVGTC